MSTVAIAVGGVDITPLVIFEDAQFTTMVSGLPGAFRFRVRDLDRTQTFQTGAEVALDIDGTRAFTGFLTSIGRQFFFPSDRSDGEAGRALVLQGVDINILFRKRIIANYPPGDPADVLLRAPYPTGTSDSDIVADLVANFLDLSGDGLDTSTLVENVGTPNPDEIGRVAFGGYTWEQAMNVIIRLTGAIYYIDPDRNLILTDVDTPNAAFSLSDMPADIITDPDFPQDEGAVQYRDMELTFDAGDLVNDAFVWGAGQGSDKMVVARVEDTDSIAAHGRWQMGDFRQDIFRQVSVDHRADSIVNGSALNHRGHKDDAISIMVTVHAPVFRAAQKVEFISHVWNFLEVIPIRRIDITFLTPTDPRFRLTLSHFIDEPWNIFEWWIPPLPPFPPIKDGIFFPFPPFTEYTVIDSFDDRTIFDPTGDNWGFASGYPADLWDATNGVVHNGFGWMEQPGNDTPSVVAVNNDYLIFPDHGLPWIGLWKYASPHEHTNAEMIVGIGTALPQVPTYVMVDGILSVATYFAMVQMFQDGLDLHIQAKQWLEWEDMPVAWDVDVLTTLNLSQALALTCDWVAGDVGGGGGIFRVDYVWQLPTTDFPSTIAPVTYGWVTINVVPDPDKRTLRLGMVFLIRTPRVNIDGNLQAPSHYVQSPGAGTIVFNDDIITPGAVEVTFFALRSI